MSEDSPNPLSQNNEMNLFKEEILKKIRELETKLTSKITTKELSISTDLNSLTSKFNLLNNNNKDILATITTQKVKLEKVSELESFKNKADNMLLTHEVRIKNNIDQIEKIKTKYDKIVSDNLYVSGYIGTNCQFRNVSEYLSFNIAEISRLKMEKDQLKRDIKELKHKFDGIMKSMINMNDNTVKLCNSYTESKTEDFEKMFAHAREELNQKNMDMRVVITKFQNDTDQKVINLMEEINKLIKSESNLNNLIKDNYYICERQHGEMKKDISDSSDNINNHQKFLNELDKKIKSLQGKIDLLNGLSSRVTRLYEMVGNNKNPNPYNTMPKTISQSPPPYRMQRKNSNPEIQKINSDSPNINTIKLTKNDLQKKFNSTNKLFQKKVRNPPVKKLNLNININPINNNMSSTEELIENKSKELEEKEKPKKVNLKKINISQDLNNTSQEKIKSNIKFIDFIEESKDKEDKKENNKETNNITKISKINQTNTIQTLPILTFKGKSNNSKIILKHLDTESNTSTSNNINIISSNNNIIYPTRNMNVNNITSQISNESHTQTQTQTNINPLNLIKKKKTELEPQLKVVSLNLSPDSALDGKSRPYKGRRPPKAKYDIVNSLINDYRAKLFSRALSTEIDNDNVNNEILDMPKRISQAFGRTTYTFIFKKDLLSAANANKNVNNFGFDGLRKNSRFQTTNIKNGIENISRNSLNIKLLKK